MLGCLVECALALLQLLTQKPYALFHLVDLLGPAFQGPNRLVHSAHAPLRLSY
jgi:hypothetical protein